NWHAKANAVDAILRGRTAGEVQMIAKLAEATWAEKFGGNPSFHDILLNTVRDSVAITKVLTHLERGDKANFYGVPADHVGRIHNAVTKAGLSQSDAEAQLRSTLATLTAKEIQEVREQYNRAWGEGTFDRDVKNLSKSDFSKFAVELYLNGSDKINLEQKMELMARAANTGLEQFEETAAHTDQATRNEFIARNGGYDAMMGKIWANYGHWYSTSDARHARDAALWGQTQEHTKIS